jgi:MFS family permease|eukprot:COSAG03_NODE_500_length_7408_cov_13.957587_7_plen_217_part_00
MLLSVLASASVAAMFWATDFGRTFLNIGGRAASGAGFIAIYVWSTELLPTSVRQGGMSLGSFSARVGSVVAPWAAEIGALLPVPDGLANDVPLALFGTSALIAGALALVVLPETRGQKSPETIAEAVIEVHSVEQRQDDPAFKIAAILGCAIGLGMSVLVVFVVEAAVNLTVALIAGFGLAVTVTSVVWLCYQRSAQPRPNWRELHRSKSKRCCPC